jgi:putative CocE/NonD family hydrolase
MTIDWDVPIGMADGIVLRADLFRPTDDGKHPVILSYVAFGKGLAFQEGNKSAWDRMIKAFPEVAEGSTCKYQLWEVVDPEKWLPDGYAGLRIDARGAGRSPGFLDPWSPREAQDIYECIEWAAMQPWCNGKVGMNGISYFASNQWFVASTSRLILPPSACGKVPPTGLVSVPATAASTVAFSKTSIREHSIGCSTDLASVGCAAA